MKKLIFMLAFIATVGSIYAQQDKKTEKNKNAQGKAKGKEQNQKLTPEERAEKITGRLKTELSLTEEQTPKVKQATLNRITQVEAARTKAAGDKKVFGAERKTIFQNWESEMKGILTSEQYSTYLAKKEEKKKKMQEKRAANKTKKSPEVEKQLEEESEEVGE